MQIVIIGKLLKNIGPAFLCRRTIYLLLPLPPPPPATPSRHPPTPRKVT